MRFFRKDRKKAPPVQVTITGGEVFVNLPPMSRRRYERNLARMRTCRLKLEELEIAGQTNTEAYRSWLAEHARRVLAVKNYEMAQATKRGVL